MPNRQLPEPQKHNGTTNHMETTAVNASTQYVGIKSKRLTNMPFIRTYVLPPFVLYQRHERTSTKNQSTYLIQIHQMVRELLRDAENSSIKPDSTETSVLGLKRFGVASTRIHPEEESSPSYPRFILLGTTSTGLFINQPLFF